MTRKRFIKLVMPRFGRNIANVIAKYAMKRFDSYQQAYDYYRISPSVIHMVFFNSQYQEAAL